MVELSSKVGLLLVKSTVSIHLGDGGGVIEASNLLNEGVVTSITRGEECKEPGRCGLHGVLSIVRAEEEFDDVGGFPQLLPSQ